MVATVVQVVALVALTVAGALVAPALGFLVGGVSLLAVGLAMEREG